MATSIRRFRLSVAHRDIAKARLYWLTARAGLRYAIARGAHPDTANGLYLASKGYAREYARLRGWRFRRAIRRQLAPFTFTAIRRDIQQALVAQRGVP